MPEIPTGGIGGQGLAQELVKELQKQSKEQKVPGKSFDDAMSKAAVKDNIAPKNMQPNAVQQVTVSKPTEGVNRVDMRHLEITQEIQKTQPEVSSPLKSLVGAFAKDQGAMGKLMDVAMSGQQFSPGQLLTLQSASYKITFEMDAMSKMAETVSGAVKTTMQTQV